jgi:hypothetical protein
VLKGTPPRKAHRTEHEAWCYSWRQGCSRPSGSLSLGGEKAPLGIYIKEGTLVAVCIPYNMSTPNSSAPRSNLSARSSKSNLTTHSSKPNRPSLASKTDCLYNSTDKAPANPADNAPANPADNAPPSSANDTPKDAPETLGRGEHSPLSAERLGNLPALLKVTLVPRLEALFMHDECLTDDARAHIWGDGSKFKASRLSNVDNAT